MPFDKSRYPPEWKEISLRIRERDGWRCKWCGAANGLPNPVTGSRVVLTVAHLGTEKPDGSPGDKHDKLDCRDENLAALCQKCHLSFDIEEHMKNARVTRIRKRQEQAASAGQQVLIEPSMAQAGTERVQRFIAGLRERSPRGLIEVPE